MPGARAGAPRRAPARRGWRGLALVLLCKAAASAAALAVGFRAVSDDDFARVVHAQAWAHAPRLDPTGTSWLPAPFWMTGAVMRAFGPGLDVARGVALALGLASAALVYLAATWILEDPDAHPPAVAPASGAGSRGSPGERRAIAERGAVAGAALAAVFPWSARLGVATVPELPAAALTLLAIASLTSPSPGRRLQGAAALLVATLCRYEPWPVAAAFAAISLLGALRVGQTPAAQAKLGLAALIALAGPAAWIAWNRVAHGEALHFLARVAAYRQALRPGDDGSLARLFAYPAAMIREEPELVLSPVALWLLARGAAQKAALVAAARAWLLPGALAALQIAALSVALVRDGAPTHHPERATLVALLVIALLVGHAGACLHAAVTAAGTAAGTAGAQEGASPPALPRVATPRMRWRVAVAVIALLVLGPGWIRRWFRREHFNARADEVAVGRAAAAQVPPDARVLLEVPHYGYFAVIAALGRPGQVVLDRSIDPRDPQVPSSFEDPAALARRLAAAGAAHFIGQRGPAAEALAGPPRAAHGRWGLWAAPAAPAASAPEAARKEPTP